MQADDEHIEDDAEEQAGRTRGRRHALSNHHTRDRMTVKGTEVIMSTPAISDGVLIVRTLDHVYGIGEK